jgi:DNA-directed RNA polymerase subunit RPC12/RpoP
MAVPFICPTCRKTNFCKSVTPGSELTCNGCRSRLWVKGDGNLRPIRPPFDFRLRSSDEARSEIWIVLDNIEALFGRMIAGIGQFLVHQVPRWIVRQVLDLGRIAAKAARVAAVFGVWLAITCLPLALLASDPGWFLTVLVLAWTGIAVAGSVFGALYATRQPGQGGRWFPRIRWIAALATVRRGAATIAAVATQVAGAPGRQGERTAGSSNAGKGAIETRPTANGAGQ